MQHTCIPVLFWGSALSTLPSNAHVHLLAEVPVRTPEHSTWRVALLGEWLYLERHGGGQPRVPTSLPWAAQPLSLHQRFVHTFVCTHANAS